MNKRQLKVVTILRNLPRSYLYQDGIIWKISYDGGMEHMKVNLTVMDVFRLLRTGTIRKVNESWKTMVAYHSIPNEYVLT